MDDLIDISLSAVGFILLAADFLSELVDVI
jgi:hypothetical protein